MIDELQIKNEMIREAILILKSVDWLQKQIEEKIKELDKIRATLGIGEAAIEKELYNLVKKIDKELLYMDQFLLKYKTLIDNEKKKSLCNLRGRK